MDVRFNVKWLRLPRQQFVNDLFIMRSCMTKLRVPLGLETNGRDRGLVPKSRTQLPVLAS
jgi:hypothetical protein